MSEVYRNQATGFAHYEDTAPSVSKKRLSRSLLRPPFFFFFFSLDLSSVNSQNPWRQQMAACQALWVQVFFFSGTTSHPGRVKVSDTKQQSKEARAQGWELLKNGVIKKKEKERKKSCACLEPQGREALPRRCNHILTLPPLMRA